MKKAKNDRTKNVIVILDYNGVPVGLLHCKQEIECRSSQKMRVLYFLTSFSINHNRQRKGYAKKSLALLQEFVQRYFPMKNEVVLAVNEKIFLHNIYMKKLASKIKVLEEWDQLVNKS